MYRPTDSAGRSVAATGGSDDVSMEEVFNFLQSPSTCELSDVRLILIKRKAATFCLVDGRLHYGVKRPKPVLLSREERHRALFESHISSSGKHRSLQQTIIACAKEYFWPELESDAREFVDVCDNCASSVRINCTANGVWEKVELSVHGPYSTFSGELKGVVALRDPVSQWIVASSISCRANAESQAHEIAAFLLANWCEYGFVPCACVVEREVFRWLRSLIDERTQSLKAEFKALAQLTLLESRTEGGIQLDSQLVGFVSGAGDDWELSLPLWLMERRVDETESAVSPFEAVFGRKPPHVQMQAAAEEGGSRRRPIRSAVLNCRHCGQTFTSRVSFGIHQQRHLEEARQQGALDGQEEDSSADEEDPSEEEDEGKRFGQRKRRRADGRRRIDPAARISLLSRAGPHPRDLTQKRGPELDDAQVASMAGSTVTSLRTMLHVTKEERKKRGHYARFTAVLRDKIAAFALKEGIQAACDFYSRELGNAVTASTVRNFIKAYQVYTPELKAEIGKFAYQFGSEACLAEFRVKNPDLDLSIHAIKRFTKYFLQNNPALSTEEVDEDGPEVVKEPASLPKTIFDTSLKDDIGQYAYHHGTLEAAEYFSERLRCPMKEATVRKFRKIWMTRNNIKEQKKENRQHGSSDLAGTCASSQGSSVHQGQVEKGVGEKPKTGSLSESKPRGRRKTKKRASASVRSSRGQYASYSVSMRAEIAKFALTHSNAETVEHFQSEHGLRLPESTVRGLRDKYLMLHRDRLDDVAGLGSAAEAAKMDFGPRGRPVRLGRYDTVVQKCILDLVASGEKLSSFLAIATAKQVLLQNEPSLLVENGGSVDLNPSWAKSFIKRINSSQGGRGTKEQHL